MKFCVACGNPLKDEALFCTKCGEKQEPLQSEQPLGVNVGQVVDVNEENVAAQVVFEAEVQSDDAPEEACMTQVVAESELDKRIGETPSSLLEETVSFPEQEEAPRRLDTSEQVGLSAGLSSQSIPTSGEAERLAPSESQFMASEQVIQKEQAPTPEKANFCGECGYALMSGAAFCTNCGHSVPRANGTAFSVSNQTKQAVSNAKETAQQVMEQIDTDKLKQGFGQLLSYIKRQLVHPNSQVQHQRPWVAFGLVLVSSFLLSISLPFFLFSQFAGLFTGRVYSASMVEYVLGDIGFDIYLKFTICLAGIMLVVISLTYLVCKLVAPRKVSWFANLKSYANYLVFPIVVLLIVTLFTWLGWSQVPLTIVLSVVAYLSIMTIPIILILEVYAGQARWIAPTFALLLFYAGIYVICLVLSNLIRY